MQDRVRNLNQAAVREQAKYVLYWTQMNRRAECNFALDFAVRLDAGDTFRFPRSIRGRTRLFAGSSSEHQGAKQFES